MTYADQIEQQLNEVDRQIAQAESKLASGDLSGKTEALHDFSVLRSRRDELKDRIAEAMSRDADQWSAFHESLHENANALRDSISAWIDRFGRL